MLMFLLWLLCQNEERDKTFIFLLMTMQPGCYYYLPSLGYLAILFEAVGWMELSSVENLVFFLSGGEGRDVPKLLLPSNETQTADTGYEMNE
jgi:hypothetical protein